MRVQIRTVKMFEANGCWYAHTRYGKRLLKNAGLKYTGGFIGLGALRDALRGHGIRVVEVRP